MRAIVCAGYFECALVMSPHWRQNSRLRFGMGMSDISRFGPLTLYIGSFYGGYYLFFGHSILINRLDEGFVPSRSTLFVISLAAFRRAAHLDAAGNPVEPSSQFSDVHLR